MMKNSILAVVVMILSLWATDGLAQEALKPRVSPLAVVTFKEHDTYVKITYGRPHKRDRELFGTLVPYGKVWRTGANEATEVTLTGDVRVAGKILKAGTYSLFTIPNEDNWTIIFNNDLGQWGSYEYKEEDDVLRVSVSAEQLESIYEPLTMEFENMEDGKANWLIMWDSTKAIIPLEFMW
ncbi:MULTISPECIES: DUF2911 domain-containing protein [Persicobacter]|uniref:DUF2911 domain-containing protein n=1 Tax=Persicobacter diffluens TaxID=981 RepID=A0AAN4W0I3_9BACT|nr:DUF2911 domain-containing protein [Persicobacter sp. CCB-QB2]GJM61700.1 hypothetical protein PEDI_22520 [Persicobacter diffluens]